MSTLEKPRPSGRGDVTRFVLSKNWARKPKARHFRIRDESKARTAEKKWLAKSKTKGKSK